MKLAVVDPTNWNGELIADSVSECARLHKCEMMRIRRRPAAYKARLPGHELPVLLIAQANRFAQSADCALARGLAGHSRSFLAIARIRLTSGGVAFRTETASLGPSLSPMAESFV